MRLRQYKKKKEKSKWRTTGITYKYRCTYSKIYYQYNQSVYKNNYTLTKRSLLESYKATSILENKSF